MRNVSAFAGREAAQMSGWPDAEEASVVRTNWHGEPERSRV
jgi:hypothetical protein